MQILGHQHKPTEWKFRGRRVSWEFSSLTRSPHDSFCTIMFGNHLQQIKGIIELTLRTLRPLGLGFICSKALWHCLALDSLTLGIFLVSIVWARNGKWPSEYHGSPCHYITDYTTHLSSYGCRCTDVTRHQKDHLEHNRNMPRRSRISVY